MKHYFKWTVSNYNTAPRNLGPRCFSFPVAAFGFLLFLAFSTFAQDAQESFSPDSVVSETQAEEKPVAQSDSQDQNNQTKKEKKKQDDLMFT